MKTIEDNMRLREGAFVSVNDYNALRVAVKGMVEDVARIAYNYGFNQGMIEARPYSNGGIDFQTAWTRMQEVKQFKQAIAAVEKVLNEKND